MTTTKHNLTTGDQALDREDRVVNIVRIVREDGVDFAWITYPNGDGPEGNGYITEGVWEHGLHDREVHLSGDYYGGKWGTEQGLRPLPAPAPVTYERVEAGDVQVGDRIARTRSATFHTVEAIDRAATTVRFHYSTTGGTDRPRQTAKWWREVDNACRHCGAADHVAGDPSTYCPPAAAEYQAAGALQEVLTGPTTVDQIKDHLAPGDELLAYTRVRADLDLLVIVRRLASGRETVGVIDLDTGTIVGDELVAANRTATRHDIDHALTVLAERERKAARNRDSIADGTIDPARVLADEGR